MRMLRVVPPRWDWSERRFHGDDVVVPPGRLALIQRAGHYATIARMDYMRLGSSGLRVSRICVGCMSFGSGADWMLGEADGISLIRRSLELGINFFDTADVYSAGESELILGRALKSC